MIRLLIWMAALAAVGLLVGCVQAAPAREPVTIAFAFPDGDAAHYEALVGAFAKDHPHITVELRPSPRGQFYAPDPPIADVTWTSQPLAGRLAEEGKIVDLGSLLEQDDAFQLSAFYPGAVDVFSREGRTWAIPFGVDVVVMYYNLDLFDKYGVPYPESGWTWNDFLERAVALRDPDAFTYGYGPRLSLDDAMLFVYQHGGRIVDDLENPTHVTFDDPLAIEALEWYARLVHDYDAAPSLNQSSRHWGSGSDSIYPGILDDRIGMWMGWLSGRGGLGWPVTWKMAWGAVPLPSDAQPATWAFVVGYAISSSTAHHDACWEWVAWLSEQMPHLPMPARRSLAESPEYEDRVGAEVAAAARTAMEEAIIVDIIALQQDPFPAAMEAFGDAMYDILQGFKTPVEAMDDARREASR